MLNLQEITLSYMSHHCQPELLEVVLTSCEVLQRFGVSQFEEDLLDLLARSEEIDTSDLRDRFIQRIQTAVIEVLAEHLITVDLEMEPTLGELNEIGLFLLSLQDLEDTEQVGYRVHGFGDAKTIVMDLMNLHTTLSRARAMEIIDQVDDRLVKAIQAMVGERAQEADTHQRQRADWLNFSRFTNMSECLGTRLYQEGYFGLTLNELSALSRFNLQTYLADQAKTRSAQAALDVLSLMYICRDTYQTPLVALENHTAELFTDNTLSGQIRSAVSALYTDFNSWLDAHKPTPAQQGLA